MSSQVQVAPGAAGARVSAPSGAVAETFADLLLEAPLSPAPQR